MSRIFAVALINVADLNKKNRYMNAEKYGLERIYFGGCFIRGVWILRFDIYIYVKTLNCV